MKWASLPQADKYAIRATMQSEMEDILRRHYPDSDDEKISKEAARLVSIALLMEQRTQRQEAARNN